MTRCATPNETKHRDDVHMGDRADAGIASLGVITLLTMTAALVVVAMQRGTFIYSVSNGASTRTLASLLRANSDCDEPQNVMHCAGIGAHGGAVTDRKGTESEVVVANRIGAPAACICSVCPLCSRSCPPPRNPLALGRELND